MFHVEQGILINCTRKYKRSTRRDVLLGATFYSARRSTRRDVLLGATFYSGRRSTRRDVLLGATGELRLVLLCTAGFKYRPTCKWFILSKILLLRVGLLRSLILVHLYS